ncbi:MAG: hypothetical protein ACK56I_28530, partial [bacterium]
MRVRDARRSLDLDLGEPSADADVLLDVNPHPVDGLWRRQRKAQGLRVRHHRAHVHRERLHHALPCVQLDPTRRGPVVRQRLRVEQPQDPRPPRRKRHVQPPELPVGQQPLG